MEIAMSAQAEKRSEESSTTIRRLGLILMHIQKQILQFLSSRTTQSWSAKRSIDLQGGFFQRKQLLWKEANNPYL